MIKQPTSSAPDLYFVGARSAGTQPDTQLARPVRCTVPVVRDPPRRSVPDRGRCTSTMPCRRTPERSSHRPFPAACTVDQPRARARERPAPKASAGARAGSPCPPAARPHTARVRPRAAAGSGRAARRARCLAWFGPALDLGVVGVVPVGARRDQLSGTIHSPWRRAPIHARADEQERARVRARVFWANGASTAVGVLTALACRDSASQAGGQGAGRSAHATRVISFVLPV
jgi:hypothetical protein